MRQTLVFSLLLPLAVYLDVVKFSGPVFGVLAVLALPLFFVFAWMRRGTKRALSRQTVLLSAAFLICCPLLTLFFANQQEERIAERVKQVAAHVAQYKSSKGQYPRNLREVDSLAAQDVFISDQSLKIGGRVVTYFHNKRATFPSQTEDIAKLSYWSFGAYQRQIFDIESGSFESPLID